MLTLYTGDEPSDGQDNVQDRSAKQRCSSSSEPVIPTDVDSSLGAEFEKLLDQLEYQTSQQLTNQPMGTNMYFPQDGLYHPNKSYPDTDTDFSKILDDAMRDAKTYGRKTELKEANPAPEKPYYLVQATHLEVKEFADLDSLTKELKDQFKALEECQYSRFVILQGDRLYTTKGALKYLKAKGKTIALFDVPAEEELDKDGEVFSVVKPKEEKEPKFPEADTVDPYRKLHHDEDEDFEDE